MTQRIRVGVVGCGEIAQLAHLPVLEELERFELTAVCDLSPTRVERLGERYGARTRTTRLEELLAADDVDAVAICTHDHADPAAAALAAGKHVLVEKPVAFTVAEGRALAALAAEAQTVALVGYMKLYDAGVESAAELLGRIAGRRAVTVHDFAGRFDLHGPLTTQVPGDDVDPALIAESAASVTERVQDALGRHAGWSSLHAMLLGLGIHDLALLRHLFGSPVDIVCAQAFGDEQLTALLDHGDGVPCVLELAIGTDYSWWDEWIHVQGREETLRIEFPNPYVRHAPTVLRQRESLGDVASERVVPVSHDSPFRRQWQHFADCVLEGARPRTPLADGVADLELATALVQALPERGGT